MLPLRIVMPVLLTCAALAGSACFGAAPAAASHGQALFFEAPGELLNPGTRPGAIKQLQGLGVHALRVELSWYDVAPGHNRRNRPRFHATSPSSYDWGHYDELLAEAKRLHWQVLLTVTAPAPRWATSNRKAPYVTRPNRRDFKQFMTAVAKHYRSEVSLYAIWNEPNEYGYLRPQFARNGRPSSPQIYRGLFEAGYEGLRKGGIGHPKVLMGETAPGGFLEATRAHPLPRYAGVAPLAFLRGSLCLDSHFHKARRCGRLPAAGYAQHPYASNTMGPFYKPPSPESVTIGTLGRLVVALNRAGKAGAIRSQMPIFLTEFGVMSKPNRYFGVSASKQAQYDAIAERIAWQNGRVAAFSQYLLKDDQLRRSRGSVSFQTGLEYANGGRKPLYFGFPVPLTVTKTGNGLSLWGLVRPAEGATKVTILVQRRKGAPYRRLASVRTGGSGYWRLSSQVQGRFWRVLWRSPGGIRYEGPPIAAYPDP